MYMWVLLYNQCVHDSFRSVSFSKHGPSWNVIRLKVMSLSIFEHFSYSQERLRKWFVEVGEYNMFPIFCNNWQPGTKVSEISWNYSHQVHEFNPYQKARDPTSTLCTWSTSVAFGLIEWFCVNLSLSFWERWLFHWDNDKSVTLNPVNWVNPASVSQRVGWNLKYPSPVSRRQQQQQKWRKHQTEAGGHFLVELSAYLACRAPRLALDVFTPSKWAGLLVGCGEPKALPECGLGNSVGQVSHVFGFLGLFLKKKVLGISRGHQMHFALSFATSPYASMHFLLFSFIVPPLPIFGMKSPGSNSFMFEAFWTAVNLLQVWDVQLPEQQ